MTEAQVKSHGVELTPEISRYLNERLEKLHRFSEHILSTRTRIEAPTGHHRQGGPFNVLVEVDVPGDLITVSHQDADNLHVAIREAFDAAQRKLEDYERLRRHEVKMPPLMHDHGVIVRLFPDESYGFIEDDEGHELYFHAHAVRDVSFKDLTVGQRVAFREEKGEKGPQAIFVRPEED